MHAKKNEVEHLTDEVLGLTVALDDTRRKVGMANVLNEADKAKWRNQEY